MPPSGFSCPVIIRNSVVLPAPLGPITPTMPPRGSVKLRSVDEQVVAVALLQMPRLDDDVAEAGARRDVDFGRLDLLRGVLAQQFLVRVQPRLALRLPGARRHPNPFELALERALPFRLGLLLLLEPFLLLLEPRRVVPFPGNAAAAIELENPAGDVVEEIPIVRDGDDGARIVLQEPLEPGDRLGVEMVGRLVEQQQIRRLQQQPAERHAAPLAARQRRDVGVRRRQPQRVHRQSRARESRSQAFAASILSWIRDCSSRTLSISSGDRSSPSFALISS